MAIAVLGFDDWRVKLACDAGRAGRVDSAAAGPSMLILSLAACNMDVSGINSQDPGGLLTKRRPRVIESRSLAYGYPIEIEASLFARWQELFDDLH
jgi:hypothetical protein